MPASREQIGSVSAFLSSRMTRVGADDNNPRAQAVVREYCCLVDRAIDERGFGPSLFRVTPEILRASMARIFLLRQDIGREPSCALHVARDPSDEFTWINGLVKADGEDSRLVQELVAGTIVHLARDYGETLQLRACYRIFPDGYRDIKGRQRSENKGSARLFQSFEFEVREIESIRLLGNEQDAHLFSWAEPGGAHIRTKVVQSTNLTVRTASELWSLLTQDKGIA